VFIGVLFVQAQSKSQKVLNGNFIPLSQVIEVKEKGFRQRKQDSGFRISYY